MIAINRNSFQLRIRVWLALIVGAVTVGVVSAPPAVAGQFPMFASWPQPSGAGTALTLEYSYSNLLDGGMLDGASQAPLDVELMRTAFELAFSDYTAHLPINFVERLDGDGPLPETGDYDPIGLAEIRIGQVPYIEDANAYAYFPIEPSEGLQGDVVFNAERSGLGWSPVLFYAVAQHELGHSLGMGHFEPCDALIEEAVNQTRQKSPYGGPQIPLAPLMIEALQGAYGAGTGAVDPLPLPEPGGAALAFGVLGMMALGKRRDTRQPKHSPAHQAAAPPRLLPRTHMLSESGRKTRSMFAPMASPAFATATRLTMVATAILLFALGLLVSKPASAISIVFDYRFDTAGFFDPGTAQGGAARSALEEAAQIGTYFTDSLQEIAPDVGNSWTTGTFLNPGGGGLTSVTDLYVPEDSILVFVGGRSFPGALGFASGATVSNITGGSAFADTVNARGQSGALAAVPTDHGPWGGSITFSSAVPWHFDPMTQPLPDTQDFLTTAIHEILHILGIGGSASWDALIEDGRFTGTQSRLLFGEDVPVDGFGAHWAEGTSSRVGNLFQETLMDPSTPRGTRQLPTDLDFAGLSDIGWQVVPEPGTAILIGLGLIALAGRRENRTTDLGGPQ